VVVVNEPIDPRLRLAISQWAIADLHGEVLAEHVRPAPGIRTSATATDQDSAPRITNRHRSSGTSTVTDHLMQNCHRCLEASRPTQQPRKAPSTTIANPLTSPGMAPRIPPKLKPGDLVRVIAPARSRALVNQHDHSAIVEARFAAMGLTLSYGEYVDEIDDFASSSIEHRVADLHAAFADPAVAAILTVIGGFNSNELLPYLDWDLIAANPKIFCGYSDITALQNAMLARSGLVTYCGPHWSSFGMRDHFEQTQRWFIDTLFHDEPVELTPSPTWTDDLWFLDQNARTERETDGWWAIHEGHAAGPIVGGNLCTLNLLQGTEFMPSLDGALLMLEDDEESNPVNFARDLTSLLQLPGADHVIGLVVGRFQRASAVTRSHVEQIVARQPALAGRPVLANVDFGHTMPLATLPIGGRARVNVGAGSTVTLEVH
jgi:muramoyltetrapeptide carboxypeptidase